ncbi:hypothetical protein Taro_020336 [Colocasia esculenta]|uniref:Uncharacterized protein n=1 Tax=Colocasia esculenta TaxID=4460 RepID=A0A843UW62_COLES|nr:hypothetical protein [Colocasia esculenta]
MPAPGQVQEDERSLQHNLRRRRQRGAAAAAVGVQTPAIAVRRLVSFGRAVLPDPVPWSVAAWVGGGGRSASSTSPSSTDVVGRSGGGAASSSEGVGYWEYPGWSEEDGCHRGQDRPLGEVLASLTADVLRLVFIALLGLRIHGRRPRKLRPWLGPRLGFSGSLLIHRWSSQRFSRRRVLGVPRSVGEGRLSPRTRPPSWRGSYISGRWCSTTTTTQTELRVGRTSWSIRSRPQACVERFIAELRPDLRWGMTAHMCATFGVVVVKATALERETWQPQQQQQQGGASSRTTPYQCPIVLSRSSREFRDESRLASGGHGQRVPLLVASGGGLVAVVVTAFPHDISKCQSMVTPAGMAFRPRGVSGVRGGSTCGPSTLWRSEVTMLVVRCRSHLVVVWSRRVCRELLPLCVRLRWLLRESLSVGGDANFGVLGGGLGGQVITEYACCASNT